MWFVAAWIVALIGANSLLRLDLLAICALRIVARAQGWYEERRAWQYPLVVALAVTGLLALAWARTRLQADWPRCAGAVIGVFLLFGVALLRAVSYHYTDRVLEFPLAGIPAGRLVEFAGLGLTAAGALRWSRAG